MLDVIFPVHSNNLERLIEERGWDERPDGALPRALAPLDVPYRVVVSAEGGLRRELDHLQAYLESSGVHWTIIHEERVFSYEAAVRRSLDYVSAPLVAIIPPWAWIDDKKWFGKLQQVFRVDGRAHVVTTLPFRTKSSTLPPHRHPHRDFTPARTVTLAKHGAMQVFGRPQEWMRRIDDLGGSRWEHPGVAIEVQPHDPHDSNDPEEQLGLAASRRPGE